MLRNSQEVTMKAALQEPSSLLCRLWESGEKFSFGGRRMDIALSEVICRQAVQKKLAGNWGKNHERDDIDNHNIEIDYHHPAIPLLSYRLDNG